MDDLSEFFSAVSVGKKKRKKEIDEVVGNAVNDFFSTISEGKKKIKEERTSIAGDSFEKLFWQELVKPEIKEEVIEESQELEPEVIVQREENLEVEQEVVSEGLLNIPPEEKTKDPLTPLNQNFVTLEELNKHYKLFLNRIQQQLSTLGGGGETRLEFLDDVNRNSVKQDHKFLRYDAPSKKWIGAYAGEAPFISSTTYVTTSSYTITENDYYIGVNYAGAVTVTLPTGVIEGTTYIVKDELGQASKGTNRYITILPSGSDLIDGRDRAILAFDYGSLTFVYRNGWRVV